MKSFRCNRCKQMFESDGIPPPLCPKCQEAREAKLLMVRELIKDNKGITAAEVHTKTGVPLSIILQYIKTGDFEVI